jgi:hypothetical protein
MAFRIPNFLDTAFRDQSALSSADIAAMVAAFNRTGVVSGMVATQRITTLTFDVSAGVAISQDRRIVLTNPTTVTLDAAHISYPRIDLIVARPNLSVPSAPSWSILALTGAAANHPVGSDTSLTDGDVLLSAVYLPANAVNVTAGMVLDKRLMIPEQIYFRPKAWGAAFDGVTDDTTAWTMCLGSIPAAVNTTYIEHFYAGNGSAGTILLEGGETMVTGPLVIPDKVHVRGIGNNVSVIGALDSSFVFQIAARTSQNRRGGDFRDFYVDGHDIALNTFYVGRTTFLFFENIGIRRSVQCGLKMEDTQNSNFYNINVEEHAGDGWTLDWGCGGNLMERCEVANIGGWFNRYLGTGGHQKSIAGVLTDARVENQNNWFIGCIFEIGNTFNGGAIVTPTTFTTLGVVDYQCGNNNGFLYCSFSVGGINKVFDIVSQSKVATDMLSSRLRFVGCYFQGRRSPTTGNGLPDPITGEASAVSYHTLYHGRGIDGANRVDVWFEGNNYWSILLAGFNVNNFADVKVPGAFGGWNSVGASGTPTEAEKYLNVDEVVVPPALPLKKFDNAVQQQGQIPINVMSNVSSDPVLRVWQGQQASPKFELRANGAFFMGPGSAAPSGTGFERTLLYNTSATPSVANQATHIYGQSHWFHAATGTGTYIGTAIGDNALMRFLKFWNNQGQVPSTGTTGVTPGVINAHSEFTGTITITGIPVGTVVTLAFDQILPAGVILVGQVTATNTVTYRFINTFATNSASIGAGAIQVVGWQNALNV